MINQYKQLILLNGQNNLNLHAEYLKATSIINPSALTDSKLQEYYFTLANNYTIKLTNNDHNTIASDNPRAVQEIINIFVKHSPKPDQPKWQKINNDFRQVWINEFTKFQLLFPNIQLISIYD